MTCLFSIARLAWGWHDDKAVVASSEKGLQELMDNINRVTQKYGMKTP